MAALVDGRYSYDVNTYLGNRVHHLPGPLLANREGWRGAIGWSAALSGALAVWPSLERSARAAPTEAWAA